MAYQIIWTAEADNDFHSILFYLKENWSGKVAQKFALSIMIRIELLSNMPYQPRFTSKENVQMVPLDKKNVLFFTIDKNNLVLLSIYPFKKDITKSQYY